MGFIAKDSGGGDFKPTPPGVYVARCYSLIDLGTQESNFQGDIKHAHKVLIGWELFGEDEDGNQLVRDDGAPFTISKRYTLSLHKKASMRHDLESWRGRPFTDEESTGFDVAKLLNAYCMVNVTHSENNGKTYSNVSSLTPLPGALKNNKPNPVHAAQVFDIDAPDMGLFDGFSDGLKDRIRASAEWSKRGAATPGAAFDDDDIAF